MTYRLGWRGLAMTGPKRNFNTNFSEAEPTSSAMTNLSSLFSTGVPQKSVMSITESRKKNGGR